MRSMTSRLTDAQRESFHRDGYLRVPGVFRREELQPAVETITAFARADLDDPSTWYRLSPDSWSVVPVHHAQSFWDLRQDPRLVSVFAQLLGTERLWVSMDRAGFKPPLSRRHPLHRQETKIHWDEDPRRPGPRSVQGLIYLTDVDPGDGGFECVPSLYRELDGWLAAHPEATEPDVRGRKLEEIPGRAGDVIIWSARLPHRGGVNHGQRPRLSFYTSYFPEGGDEDRSERIANWREKRAPAWWRGWVDQPDPEPGEPARLTALGRRLLGLDAYPAR